MVDRETDRCVSWIKEAIWIRKIAPTKNRDERATESVMCGTVCSPRHLVSSEDTVPDEHH